MKSNRAVVQALWDYMNDLQWEKMKSLLSEDFTAVWPQAKASFIGASDYIEMNKNYPGQGKITVKRITDLESAVLAEVHLEWNYSEQKKDLYAVGLYQVKEGKIFKATEYWCDTYIIPEYHKQWAKSCESFF